MKLLVTGCSQLVIFVLFEKIYLRLVGNDWKSACFGGQSIERNQQVSLQFSIYAFRYQAFITRAHEWIILVQQIAIIATNTSVLEAVRKELV